MGKHGKIVLLGVRNSDDIRRASMFIDKFALDSIEYKTGVGMRHCIVYCRDDPLAIWRTPRGITVKFIDRDA